MVKAPKSVTSLLFSNFYIGLKSTNALNIMVFLLPTKLLPRLNYLSAQPDLCSAPSCSCYSLRCHPLSTTYIFFSKNHQSLISLWSNPAPLVTEPSFIAYKPDTRKHKGLIVLISLTRLIVLIGLLVLFGLLVRFAESSLVRSQIDVIK